MKKHILITGATGFIGRKLIDGLIKSGHTVAVLSRKPRVIKNVKVYLWDVEKQQIDLTALKGVETIIHLAGENIADKKWTKERKQQLIESRTVSTQVLYKAIRATKAPVTTFISASAVGYYGNRGDEILTEDDEAGSDFMATCCKLWEAAVDEGTAFDLRIVKFRIGIVFAKGRGALQSMEKQIRFFAGAPLGSGMQWIPWIHINDIVALFKRAVEDDSLNGTYNACAPFPVTNRTLTKSIATHLDRPVWPINVPEKALKMLLGQMSAVVLNSTNTSAQKLLTAGFQFEYTQLDDALSDIYRK
jgi:uncharacterized protein (TIGR01777 family)